MRHVCQSVVSKGLILFLLFILVYTFDVYVIIILLSLILVPFYIIKIHHFLPTLSILRNPSPGNYLSHVNTQFKRFLDRIFTNFFFFFLNQLIHETCGHARDPKLICILPISSKTVIIYLLHVLHEDFLHRLRNKCLRLCYIISPFLSDANGDCFTFTCVLAPLDRIWARVSEVAS